MVATIVKNLIDEIKKLCPQVSEYFLSLCVKIERPFEMFFSIEDHDNGYMDYQIVQYLIVGYSSGSKEIKIGNIEIGISDCHPAATYEDEHLIIYAVSFQIRGVPLSPMVNYCFERSNI